MSDEPRAIPRRDLALLFERWGPGIAGLVSVALLSFFADYVAERFEAGDWSADGLYRAVFGWSAIQTGFSFGVYGFVVGRRDGFVGALQGTVVISRFITYVKRSHFIGFLLTVISLPLIVWSPAINCAFSVSFILVVLWFSTFVWAFCSFLRVACNFARLSNVRDRVLYRA